MKSDRDTELMEMDLQRKGYIYASVENCVIYLVVFLGVCVYKVGWMWLLLLFCNCSEKKDSKKAD